jgi:outer membrane protein assembly factor BamE (lipoprotein component of BamABCDE complex)
MTSAWWSDLGRWAARLGAALVVALTLAACATLYRNHGYVPTEQELAVLEVGVDTRESVATTIGRPSAQGLLNDVGWYYIQSRFELMGGREPKEVDRQVVAITFTEDGVVANIERFGLESGRVVQLSRRVTATNVKSASVLRQLFGNIGGVDAAGLVD